MAVFCVGVLEIPMSYVLCALLSAHSLNAVRRNSGRFFANFSRLKIGVADTGGMPEARHALAAPQKILDGTHVCTVVYIACPEKRNQSIWGTHLNRLLRKSLGVVRSMKLAAASSPERRTFPCGHSSSAAFVTPGCSSELPCTLDTWAWLVP